MEPWLHGQFELLSLKPLDFIVSLVFLFLFVLFLLWPQFGISQLSSDYDSYRELPTQANWCHYKLMEVCLPSSYIYIFFYWFEAICLFNNSQLLIQAPLSPQGTFSASVPFILSLWLSPSSWWNCLYLLSPFCPPAHRSTCSSVISSSIITWKPFLLDLCVNGHFHSCLSS